MTLLTWMLSLGLVLAIICGVADAAPVKAAHKTGTHKVAAKKAAGKKDSSADLQTDVKFGDNVLHGQYQVPEEALAKVENEKALGDLIGVRKHFKDRLSTAAEQE